MNDIRPTDRQAAALLAPSAVRTTRLVAAREISERIGSRALRITTAILTLLVIAGVVVPGLIHGAARTVKIGLIGARAQALAQQSLDPATRALLAATVDATHQRRLLRQAGLPAATVRAAQQPLALTTVAIQPPPTHKAARDVAAVVAGFLLYIMVTIYGGAVATGVAQEKTSRTAEVLLATVRPGQLLAGKVIGIGLCGVVQLAIPIIAGLIADAVVHSAEIPSTV